MGIYSTSGFLRALCGSKMVKVPKMALFFILLAISSANTDGFSLDAVHRQCDTDHECDEGFYCYESNLCTRCIDCPSYMRKAATWRSCAKTPSECGVCADGYEEEILHGGKTRDICIRSSPRNLTQSIKPDFAFSERFLWAGALVVVILPILYYTFVKKNQIRARGVGHCDLRREDPPPYRSIELTTLSSNNSEEQLSTSIEEGHVLSIRQQKDHLVEAVPFQKPAYMEEELLAYENTPGDNSNEPEYHLPDETEVAAVSSVELHDENTMPSDWTPDENSNNGQLMSFELPVTSDTQECVCEPSAKRQKKNNPEPVEPDEESSNPHNLSINLFINNNVTIHKPH